MVDVNAPWTRASLARAYWTLGVCITVTICAFVGAGLIVVANANWSSRAAALNSAPAIVVEPSADNPGGVCVLTVSREMYACECHGCAWLCQFTPLWRGPELSCVWSPHSLATWRCPTQAAFVGGFSSIVCKPQTPCEQAPAACRMVVQVDNLVYRALLILGFVALALLVFGFAVFILKETNSKRD